MLPKCPFFQKPCLREDCTAYQEDEIYVAAVSPGSANKEFKNLDLIVRGECLYRIKEVCHALKIELPRKI